MNIKSIIKSADSLINRKNITVILLVTLFILFANPISIWYDNTIVTGILSKVKSIWYLDITFIILTVLDLVILITSLCTNRKVSTVVFSIFLFAFILFVIARYFSNEHYQFYSFATIKFIKYADFLILLCFSFIVIKVKNWITIGKEPIGYEIPFIVDSPITSYSKDKFSRRRFSEYIAKKIQSKVNNPDAGSLAVGINGVWGSGKTSFMYMIKECITSENRIVMDFNPWRSSSSSEIVKDFFTLLVSKLSQHDESLSSSINEYAKTLTEIDENRITRGINTLSSFLFNDADNNASYDRINKSILKSKKQILIFIDDLDRLDKREIIEVLRIIRNTANFSNLVYIVSYDKDYILEAIKSFNSHNYKSFLEKIFQFEFTLPAYEEGVNRESIKQLLKNNLEEEFHKQVDWAVDDRPISGLNFTNEMIRTQRDAIRFANSILLEIHPIKKEVLFYDFYLLQLLKLKYPKVYTALVENRYKFFIAHKDKNNNTAYRFRKHSELNVDDEMLGMLKSMQDTNHTSQSDRNGDVSEFKTYLNEIKQTLDLTNYDLHVIEKLVEAAIKNKAAKEVVFGRSEQDKEREKLAHKGLCNPRNFHKYFAFRLFEADLSDYEFEEYRLGAFEEYFKKVQSWLEQGKYSELKDRLLRITDFSSIREFENHVKILFELGRIEAKQTNPYLLDYSLIFKALRYPSLIYPQEKIKIRLYNTEEDYRAFLSSILFNAPSPWVFESNVIATLITDNGEFVFSSSELEKINLDYFEKYLHETSSITREFWNLYHNCKIKSPENLDRKSTHPKALEIAKTEYKGRIKECDLGRFIRQANPGSSYYYLDKDEWSFAFNTTAEFEDWFNSVNNINRESACFEEFKSFYSLSKEQDFEAIMFEFKSLRPIRWV